MMLQCVWAQGGGGGGMDGGCKPLPFRPQRYCDNASLVNDIEVAIKIPKNILKSRF